jgi:3-deoxy-manno-octulosonate cytidylyltransferase (CMP-KDO synthetase)
MSVLVVIPARYGSTRLPGKPLAQLAGKPLIQHVYERVVQAKRVDQAIVATDDQRIVDAVKRFGGTAVMTSASARSGSERAAEAARARTEAIIINVQGDEPLVHPDMIDQLAEFLAAHPAVPMASVMTPLRDASDAGNPNVVKVVTDRDGYALYFSRAPIPFRRQETGDRRQVGDPSHVSCLMSPTGYFKHIGIYGYQRHFLLQFPSLEPTPLEQSEQLEQLRALEHGYKIKLLETVHDTIGVDTPEDLKRVEAFMQQSAHSVR